MSRRPHILISRRIGPEAPNVWSRCDWDGIAWRDLSTKIENRVATSQTALHALVAEMFAELGSGADLTITPRPYTEIIERGDPAGINVPIDASLDVLLPLGRENAPHEAEFWVRALIQPASGLAKVLLDKKFVEKRLAQETKAILTQDDLKERCRVHDLREFWVRHDVTGAQIDPHAVPRYTAPAPALPDPAAEAYHEYKARSSRVKGAGQRQAAAAAADRVDAAAFAEKQSRARAAATK